MQINEWIFTTLMKVRKVSFRLGTYSFTEPRDDHECMTTQTGLKDCNPSTELSYCLELPLLPFIMLKNIWNLAYRNFPVNLILVHK